MPATPLPIPINGYSDSLNHQHGAAGFTPDALNVVPMDNWEHRRRMGARQGFQAIADMGSGDDENIQLLLTYEVYRDTTLVQEVLIVAGGNVYIADEAGDTTLLTYYTASAPLDVLIKSAVITSTDTVRGVQMGNHLFLVTGNAYYMIDVSQTTPTIRKWWRLQAEVELEFAVVAVDGDTIELIDATGTSKVYSADDDGPNGTLDTTKVEFVHGSSAEDSATNLAAAIVHENGHAGTLSVVRDGAKLTITQNSLGDTGIGGWTAITYVDAAGDNGDSFVQPEPTHFAGVDPELPTAGDDDTHKATLITRFGGRVVLSGIATSDTNWFMSAISDPFDWRSTWGAGSEYAAIAGSDSTEFGKLGEPIVAMFPFGGNGLMMAGRNTLTYLTNDPAVSGTQFVRMSNSVGALGPNAWCHGPEKTALVASTDGVYLIAPNDFNIERGEAMTAGKLDGVFATLDPNDVEPLLAFDSSRQSAMLFMNRPSDPTGATHYQFHFPTQSWWPVWVEDSRFGEITAHATYSPVSGEREGVWYGAKSGRISIQPPTGVLSWDGGAYSNGLRSATNNSPNTGGETPFLSRLSWAPINSGVSNTRSLLTEINVLLDNHTQSTPPVSTAGPTMKLYGGDMAQDLFGIPGDLAVTETRQAIDMGDAATTPTTSIDGGVANTRAATVYAPSMRATITLTLGDGTTAEDLDETTLTIRDPDGSFVITFDAGLDAGKDRLGSCGLGGATSEAAILESLKKAINLGKTKGSTGVEAGDVDGTARTIELLQATGTGYDGNNVANPSSTAAEFTIPVDGFTGGTWVDHINGGLSEPVTGAYAIQNTVVGASRRTYESSLEGYTVRRSGVTPDHAQLQGLWGLWAQSNFTVPEYVASTATSTPPEAVLTSTEGLPRSVATGTVTFSSAAAIAGEIVTITDYSGVTKIYIADDDGPNGTVDTGRVEFVHGSSFTDSATNLKATIEHANGHNGTIIVTQDAGVLTLTQAVSGASGNNTITETGTNIAATGFTGGDNTSDFTASTVALLVEDEGTGKDLLGTWTLRSGRNNRFRCRHRRSDFAVEISADGKTWVLEDIAVDVTQGGPYRAVTA